MVLGFGMLRRRRAIPWIPWAGPCAQSRGCRPTVRCCMVGRSILNSMIDSRVMPYRRTILYY